MVSAYDVNPHQLIRQAASRLEKVEGLKAPEWVGTVKSGAHRERLPQDGKFWYMRCASILYQAYCHSPVGVSSLQTHYGGRQKRGVAREHFQRAGGNMIRKALQAMEKTQLLSKKKVGRYIAPKGQQLLDAAANDLAGKKKKEA